MQLVCCISRIPVFCQLTALELNAVIEFVLPEEWPTSSGFCLLNVEL